MDEEIRALERAAKDDPEAARQLEVLKRRTGWVPPSERLDQPFLELIAKAVHRPKVDHSCLPSVAAHVRSFLTAPERVGCDGRQLVTRWYSPKHRTWAPGQVQSYDDTPEGPYDAPPLESSRFVTETVPVKAVKESGREKRGVVSLMVGTDPEAPGRILVAAAEAKGQWHGDPWADLKIGVPYARVPERTVLDHLRHEGVSFDEEILREWAQARGAPKAVASWGRKGPEPKPVMPGSSNRYSRRKPRKGGRAW